MVHYRENPDNQTGSICLATAFPLYIISMLRVRQGAMSNMEKAQ
jgi:hypothetical protein